MGTGVIRCVERKNCLREEGNMAGVFLSSKDIFGLMDGRLFNESIVAVLWFSGLGPGLRAVCARALMSPSEIFFVYLSTCKSNLPTGTLRTLFCRVLRVATRGCSGIGLFGSVPWTWAEMT